MDLTLISDLHGHYPKLEGGDLLIVAGDLTASDKAHQLMEFGEWLTKQDYEKKVVIAGNHDNLIHAGRWNICPPVEYGWDFEYLCDSGTEFEYWDGLTQDPDPKVWLDSIYKDRKRKFKIWGSPWTKTFPGMNPHCKSFTVDTEEELAEKFAKIPDDTDILITHSPPYGILDWNKKGNLCGSTSLRDTVIDRLQLKLHVFGHLHEAAAVIESPCIYVNASHVNERYQPVNPPIRIEL